MSSRKDEEIKYKARVLARLLDSYENYEVINSTHDVYTALDERGLEHTPDNIIVASAYLLSQKEDITFISDDLNCKNIARNIFKLNTEGVYYPTSSYKGFKEVSVTEQDIDYFCEHINENIYDLSLNEYLLLTTPNKEYIDCYRWTGETHETLYNKQIKSLSFGDKLRPKDIYQKMAIDSLVNNTMTAISGAAGSGKSLLSLMVAMYLVDSGKYDRLVVLYNPIKVRGAESQGYYPGTSVEKAMQSGIGQILTTKFGDRFGVDVLLQQDKLKLVCMADCRGMEIKDNEILWITEAENTSIDLLKICLSRVSSGAKVFIEGDFDQIDGVHFLGSKNGMKRAIEVFREEPEFGYVELQNVWRSRIAELCERL